MGGIISPQSKKIKREGTRHHPEEVITEEILSQSKKIKREGTRHLPEEVITEEILPQSKKIKREGTRHLPEEVITEEILPQSKKIKREGTRHLPEEIITEEILPRLPVKSLLKFRCVTKSWCSLIESKRFVKAHLENSIKSSRSAHDPILKFYIADEVYVPSLFETDRKSFNADFGIDSDLEIYVVGCCNGLVCLLLVKKRFILWNPATRKFHNLRDFPNNTESPNIVFYGFGFDELNDDYKVFALVWDSYSDDIYSIVYCLRSNLWKVIEKTGDFISSDDDSVTPQDFAGLCVNGKLHWYKYASEIVSFDLNSYVDGVVQLPIHPMECCVRLGVVEGCLSAHYFHKENFVLDVWILKEYGVKESWGKVATIPCYKFSKGLAIPSPSPSPIAIDPNGDIFLTWGYGIVIYSTKSDDRYSNMTNGDLFREMSIYIESLASVAPDDEQES